MEPRSIETQDHRDEELFSSLEKIAALPGFSLNREPQDYIGEWEKRLVVDVRLDDFDESHLVEEIAVSLAHKMAEFAQEFRPLNRACAAEFRKLLAAALDCVED